MQDLPNVDILVWLDHAESFFQMVLLVEGLACEVVSVVGKLVLPRENCDGRAHIEFVFNHRRVLETLEKETLVLYVVLLEGG